MSKIFIFENSRFFGEALNVGTVPMFKMHKIGTVPTFKMHNIGTVPTYKTHNVYLIFIPISSASFRHY